MTEPRTLVERARAGDASAFARLVEDHQDWAVGYAVALLGDFHLAQDAAQEAFAAAHAALPTLAEPTAFPAWLKSIVRHSCSRALRKRGPGLVPLDWAMDVPPPQPGPDRFAEEVEQRRELLGALESLPRAQREVVLLHYWREYSHREIAALLGIPVTTVNNRLHLARLRLREEVQAMAESTNLTSIQTTTPAAGPVGQILAARGAVVDVRFPAGYLPPPLTVLTARGAGSSRSAELVVAEYPGQGIARAVVLTGEKSLREGVEVVVARRSTADVDPRAVRRAAAELLRPERRPASAGEKLVESGIKPIDLFAPISEGDAVGITGGAGVGKIVLVQELMTRLGTRGVPLRLVVPLLPSDQSGAAPGSIGDDAPFGYGDVQVTYLPVPDPVAPPAGISTLLDVQVSLSRSLATSGMFPAVDPVGTSSRHLDSGLASAEHVESASRVRELLRRFPMEADTAAGPEQLSSDEGVLLGRARRLRRFLTQPFFVAAPWTRWKAAFVPVADTLRGCRGILDGAYDSLPEEAFYMANGIEEVVARAAPASK